MSQQRRKLLTGLGTVAALSPWTKPIVNHVLLPAHAQISPEGPVLDVQYQIDATNVVCNVGTPNSVTFDFVSNEADDVTITELSVPIGRQHISPALPVTISSGQTISFVVESTENNTANCPNLHGFNYLAESASSAGFTMTVLL